jgi:hypothetical protein
VDKDYKRKVDKDYKRKVDKDYLRKVDKDYKRKVYKDYKRKVDKADELLCSQFGCCWLHKERRRSTHTNSTPS